ncbi:hypothetical protein PTTG_25868 [Puccinia triticina 1-1 BBBD Race 1]|uniref:Secreted protein n=2 Tax=Puccinia triticina TaxID=208348 RepID=A0A180GYT6_PUCT1|nr:uncharacterized protein PtA15_15A416 [Puccinia triticina]OAV97900.1 hypothetical protein PTTG_25868 [Puccinia triticina 1-1 BBBD Race 1]WAQ92022.1 hypothetical protein PtA15_15A416 [Puccinia triticina]
MMWVYCPMALMFLTYVWGCNSDAALVCFSPNAYNDASQKPILVQFPPKNADCYVNYPTVEANIGFGDMGKNAPWRARCCLTAQLAKLKHLPSYDSTKPFYIPKHWLTYGRTLLDPPSQGVGSPPPVCF